MTFVHLAEKVLEEAIMTYEEEQRKRAEEFAIANNEMEQSRKAFDRARVDFENSELEVKRLAKHLEKYVGPNHRVKNYIVDGDLIRIEWRAENDIRIFKEKIV